MKARVAVMMQMKGKMVQIPVSQKVQLESEGRETAISGNAERMLMQTPSGLG